MAKLTMPDLEKILAATLTGMTTDDFQPEAKKMDPSGQGPAQGLPDSKVGTLSQVLYDEAKKDGWVVISMKKDWKRVFAFEG